MRVVSSIERSKGGAGLFAKISRVGGWWKMQCWKQIIRCQLVELRSSEGRARSLCVRKRELTERVIIVIVIVIVHVEASQQRMGEERSDNAQVM